MANPDVPVVASFPIAPPSAALPFVDPQSGRLTTTGLQVMQLIYAAIQGGGGVVPSIETLQAEIVAIEASRVLLTAASPAFPSGRVLVDDPPGLVLDVSVAGLATLILDVIAALGFTPARDSEPFVTYSATGTLSNERVLTGSTGVTIDTATAGLVKVLINVATALGYTPANAAYYPATVTTVAGLGAAGTAGRRWAVNDSNATLTAGIGAVVAAGGANVVPVFDDGTNWRIG